MSAFIYAPSLLSSPRHLSPSSSRSPMYRPRPLPILCSSPPQETAPLIPTHTQETPAPQNPLAPGLASRTSALDPRVLFGEFLCTFLFNYLSLTAVAASSPFPASLNAAIIAALATSFIPISGAHLNPAVTVSLLITNRIPPLRALFFIPIQVLAAVSAASLLPFLGLSVTFPGIEVPLARALADEIIPMFIIVVVVFLTAVATEEEGGVGLKLAGAYIGLTVLACAGTFTGIFNPARALGPALIAGNLKGQWVYWLGPMLGAIVAAFICEHCFMAPAVGRTPNSWLQNFSKKATNLGSEVKNLGVAGIVAYGIMNTLYYGIVFTAMMFKVGLSSGAAGIAQAWFVTWSLSQVTKPLRLGLSIMVAPFIDRFLKARRQQNKRS